MMTLRGKFKGKHDAKNKKKDHDLCFWCFFGGVGAVFFLAFGNAYGMLSRGKGIKK